MDAFLSLSPRLEMPRGLAILDRRSGRLVAVGFAWVAPEVKPLRPKSSSLDVFTELVVSFRIQDESALDLHPMHAWRRRRTAATMASGVISRYRLISD